MTLKEPGSKYLHDAMEEIKRVHGKPMSLEQRELAAIQLAANILHEATNTMTGSEKRTQAELARMMHDKQGKAFTTLMTDQCFRSHKAPRVANQLNFLLQKMGVPSYLSLPKRISLGLFQLMGQALSYIFVPMATLTLRQATSKVILPGEPAALKRHIQLRRQQGVRLNLNHLGEAILGEEEAKIRLQIYLNDLKQPDIEYVSIKISTIYSQLNLLAWNKTLDILSERLRELYRAAMANKFTKKDGTQAYKFVNLDMEEFRDLHLTKDLFKKVLSEPEFKNLSAGIVLQAYLPDSHMIQVELTEWAMERVKAGGAPIKIRIVKGANLAMEQFESSLRDWPQSPYKKKSDVDANYKKMATYGCMPQHAKAVHLGIASHNLFDISYALLLRSENKIEEEITFEMLEGMADHMRRVVQKLAGDILLYCPIATKEDFQSAIAYLIRRLDENTGPDNFLRHAFGLKPGTKQWDEQVLLFTNACREQHSVSTSSRRYQDRNLPPIHLPIDAPFENEPDTDFSLYANRMWAEKIAEKWKNLTIPAIPLVIAGKEIHQPKAEGIGEDPGRPGQAVYSYSMADWPLIEQAIQCAKQYESTWANTSVEHRCELLAKAAQKMREKRGDLIGCMMVDGGKTIVEGDPEVSEAIDFADYYLRSMKKMHACQDIQWKPKGTVLVTPPWNFPISIPAGGILAALVAGNCVLFKPAPETVLSGWLLVNELWNAGIPKEALQFINCPDEPVGSKLIQDKRINFIVLTGATSTARLFMRLRPGLDLAAETGGKNAIIVTAMGDRDLAIKDIVHSAFGHSGQKCSACSLVVLEAEVYDDPIFRKQLKDAVESLKTGSCWDLSNKVIPVIHEPGEALKRGLTQLEPGEEWLVKPKSDPNNHHLWSPGVKWGVKDKSFMHMTELFGPVVGVMRAANLEDAIRLVNDTPYGLTSGLQSLDEREQKIWIDKIQAGNCYINRTVTGAIVRRQPFGGTKASCYGHGSKAGGPNYLMQFAHPITVSIPQEKHPVKEEINRFSSLLQKNNLSVEELGTWYASICNYAYWGKRFSEDHDPSQIVGQDNIFRYRPHQNLCFRMQDQDKPLDILRVLAAALSCDAKLTVSWSKDHSQLHIKEHLKNPLLHFIEETDDQFLDKIKQGAYSRIRLISKPSDAVQQMASSTGCYLGIAPVLANGRFELLHHLREISLSIDYHRYGNLNVRESEPRKPIL